MNETKSNNTYVNNEYNNGDAHSPTPIHFWRSNKTWRTTNTGMNENVIRKKAPYTGKREYLDTHIDKIIYCTVKERNDRKTFIETVNGCIGDIYSFGVGYVFTDAQLTGVKSVLPKVRTSRNISNCCYSCRR